MNTLMCKTLLKQIAVLEYFGEKKTANTWKYTPDLVLVDDAIK